MIVSPFELRPSGEIVYMGRTIMQANMSEAGAANTVAALNLAHALGQRDAVAAGVSLDEATQEVNIQVRMAKASVGFYA